MCWDTEHDLFTFKFNVLRVDPDVGAHRRPPTKRQMLSVTMSVFDPFGFLCDIMLYAKLLVQEVWHLGSSWDEPVPQDIFNRLSLWLTELKAIYKCRVPRWYSPFYTDSDDRPQLHIFDDASEAAFAAAAYWRIGRPDGTYDVCFIAGKTRCAPLKLLSVLRLELQAAVLATRLRTTIEDCHKARRVHFWSEVYYSFVLDQV